jgi:hypothetical protein
MHVAEEWVSRAIMPPSEVIIGLALMQEAFDKHQEIRLEQIADAVEVYAEQATHQKSHNVQRGARG